MRHRAKFTAAVRRIARKQKTTYRDPEEVTLESIQRRKRLLPKQIFLLGLGRQAGNPFHYFLLDFYRITLLQLRVYLKRHAKFDEDESDAVRQYLALLPLRNDPIRVFGDWLEFRGQRAKLVKPRLRRELLELVEEALEDLNGKLSWMLKRHSHIKKCLAVAQTQIERDIITLSFAASGALDSINFATSQLMKIHWTIDEICKDLSLLYKRHELELALSPTSPLFAHEILELNLDDFVSSRWRKIDVFLNPAFMNRVSSKEALPPSGIRAPHEYIQPKATLKDVVLPEATKKDLLALCEHYKSQSKRKKDSFALKFLFSGPPGTGKTFSAEAIAGTLGKKLLKVSLPSISSDATPQIVSFFVGRARVSNSVLLFDECENLISQNRYLGFSDNWIKILFETFEGVAVFTTNYSVPVGFDRRMTYVIHFKNPTPKLRERILVDNFENLKAKTGLKEVPPKKLASSLAKEFSIPGGYYESTLHLALAKSNDRKTGKSKPTLKEEAILEAFNTVQERLGQPGNDSIREPRISLSEIKLEPQLESQIKKFTSYARKLQTEKQSPLLPKGATALFSGPPGTGKTITAEAIAHQLGLDFRRVSPSSFMSPWFGETEANVKRVFREAEQERYLLFIDEAEGMLGDRQADAGPIRHTIINEFLQQIEAFKGILIVATNFSGMMDIAFGRRFLFHMAFSIPSFETRLELWKAWKRELQLDSRVLESVAKDFELSGGEIRNVAIKAGVNGHRTLEELSQLCDKAILERTGYVKRGIGIRA